MKPLETTASGHVKCPECGAAMVPMRGSMAGRGFNCSMQTWSRQAGRSGCPGVKWATQRSYTPKTAVARPEAFPLIKNRTQEQEACRADLLLAPSARPERTRLIVWNAGPGTGKSTTAADGAEALYRRYGAKCAEWHFVAFNVNAADSLRAKIPQRGPTISTINGFGGRLQGYQSKQYKTNKLRDIFAELVKDIPYKERPRFGCLKAFAERLRDQLAFPGIGATAEDWNAAIDAMASRFPSLSKKMDNEKTAESVREYLPQIVGIALRHGQTIDLSEQYSRPVTLAQEATGYAPRAELLANRAAEWTDDDYRQFAAFVRKIEVPSLPGVVVDEAQDLSLSQVALFLATTWRSGELILIGDDYRAEPYKAGQGIFGWRGSFPGSLAFIARIWEELTGEGAINRDLSVSFRCPPEICNAVKELNTTLTSAKPVGSGEAAIVGPVTAFDRWCAIDEECETALWLTRRNAPLAEVFLATVKARKRVTLRGGGDFSAKFDSVMYDAAGYYNDAGEYRVSLADAVAKLRDIACSDAGEDSDGTATESKGDDFAGFILALAEEVLANPSILTEAQADGQALPPVATVGNLRRFVAFFTDRDAPRVCSTVYRAKGDEATVVIVSDTEAMNAAWNGDENESAAVRLVALTRAKRSLWLTGSVTGATLDCESPEATPAAFAAVKEDKPATVAPVVATVADDEPEALAIAAREAMANGNAAEAVRLARLYRQRTGQRLPLA